MSHFYSAAPEPEEQKEEKKVSQPIRLSPKLNKRPVPAITSPSKKLALPEESSLAKAKKRPTTP